MFQGISHFKPASQIIKEKPTKPKHRQLQEVLDIHNYL